MLYQVQVGDSPDMIARRHGVTTNALINANSHKSTRMVAGRRTWDSLRPNETITVPVGGRVHGLGAIAPAAMSAPHAQIKQGSTGADVALWQTIIGTTADGVFGPNTAAATKAWQSSHGLSADGIVGPKTWAAAINGNAPVASASLPAVAAAASTSISVGIAAAAAVAALVADPGYCTSVAKSGTAVNTAIHNFKAAYNSANPSSALPINTGKYEPVVASALSSALGGVPVPPGCGAIPSAAAPPPPPVTLPSLPSIPQITPVTTAVAASVPAALAALASIDPCYSGNVSMVCAAQSVLGVTVDGKYGADTAAALRKYVPNAPAGCATQSWWAAKGKSNCGVVMPSLPTSLPTSLPSLPSLPTSLPSLPSTPWVPPASSQPTASAPSQTVTVNPASGGAVQPPVVAPTDKKISTGAMIAGGIGIAALLGVVAVAASGHKSSTKTSTTTVRRLPARRKPAHKPAHKKTAHKKKR